MQRHLKPLLPLKMRAITFQEIEEYKNKLSDVVSNRTTNIVLIQLRKLFKYAIRLNFMDKEPNIVNLKENRKEIVSLTKSQLKKLIEVSKGCESVYFYVCVMAFTGMRPNEFLTLQWDQVNLKSKYIDVVSDNSLKKGRRIPVHDKLIAMFKKRTPKKGNVCPYRSRFGARKMINRYGKKMGIDISPYSLRKTFASLMAEQEVSPFKVAKLMGHASISTTYKYYVAFESEKLKKDIERHPMASDFFGRL